LDRHWHGSPYVVVAVAAAAAVVAAAAVLAHQGTARSKAIIVQSIDENVLLRGVWCALIPLVVFDHHVQLPDQMEACSE
jgi:2-hydroxychromene-2-carboxylate isomerase